MSDVEVKKNEPEQRYEAWLDGELAGFAQYTISENAVVFTHTQVFGQFEGRGVGGALARGALDDARAAGSKVVPVCPFFEGWIDKHPDYQDLLLNP
jgi:predicted GNAT family acetyltransferase